jgi:hypothetical protein
MQQQQQSQSQLEGNAPRQGEVNGDGSLCSPEDDETILDCVQLRAAARNKYTAPSCTPYRTSKRSVQF